MPEQEQHMQPGQIEAHTRRLQSIIEGLRKYVDDGRAKDAIPAIDAVIAILKQEPFSTQSRQDRDPISPLPETPDITPDYLPGESIQQEQDKLAKALTKAKDEAHGRASADYVPRGPFIIDRPADPTDAPPVFGRAPGFGTGNLPKMVTLPGPTFEDVAGSEDRKV